MRETLRDPPHPLNWNTITLWLTSPKDARPREREQG